MSEIIINVENVQKSFAEFASRLAFKNRELAEYSGKQFIDIYKDFVA